ncbi:hypothetical protein FOZ63_023280, partial [Perkinsus olseni]
STTPYGHIFRSPPEDSRPERAPLIMHNPHMVSSPVTVHTRKVAPRASVGPSKSDGEATQASKDSKRHRTRDALSNEAPRSHRIKLHRSRLGDESAAAHPATRSRSRKPNDERAGASERRKHHDGSRERKHHKHRE